MNLSIAAIIRGALSAAVLAASLSLPALAQQAAVTRTELLRTDLEGVEGLEGVMYVTDVAPAGAAPRHFHPGYEFNYVLQGALVFEPDGEKPFTLSAGQATYNPLKHVHAVRNASATEPAKLVVVLVHQKGQPLAVPAQ